MDIELNRTTHDLQLKNYDLQLLEEAPLVQQRLKQSLLFFLGEWYLDITDGVPYYQEILIKAPIQVTVESILKNTILETPDVQSLERFELEYDNQNRAISLDFAVSTPYGNIEISEELT